MPDLRPIEDWLRLSPVQREAASWPGGPLLLLAGPGAGKTKVLAWRIARLLAVAPGPDFKILGLTFTNKAADELRERVARLAPRRPEGLFIGTFHSFCAHVLRRHGRLVGVRPGFRICSEDAELREILIAGFRRAARSDPDIEEPGSDTLREIQLLKSELVFPACTRDERLIRFYAAYEAELEARSALDFNSLILKSYELFSRFPDLVETYAGTSSRILVDEFQDTTEAQYRLLRTLAGGRDSNLFVVADDDQLIYRWNGANPRRLAEFRAQYAPGVIELPVNYRCPPEVVALAQGLILRNPTRAGKRPLEAVRPSPGPGAVRLLPRFADEVAEADGIAEDIARLRRAPRESVAILARNRRLLDGAAAALGRQSGRVELLTIHEAKGTEFHHVYLLGLAEGEFPSRQSRERGDQSPELEEERRCCFVAITRAISSLTLSFARGYNGRIKEPSRFLYELGLLEPTGWERVKELTRWLPVCLGH